ncbi:MAG: site-specific DNA-methyltransferase [Acidobacteriota bacterium]|nr:site-specific DNA-methyltransferase [Acidobacteriota bacterium]
MSDCVLDPFAGTGTTAVVAKQLNRNSANIEIDKANAESIKERIEVTREADNIEKFYKDYVCTENLNEIWGKKKAELLSAAKPAAALFNL